ncbi:TetR/AcrR family transcriptional regulator [Enterococcus sp. HY326]|uniref:TetR/AcrR family transcriptional regulator n=1 Tax=Enterococcus sp. HY326 TaxID=2971265 RepID=UPI00224061A1|nr:TetR/AcrR family transcriptional regulator [Enterococcus sp. HY326]
MVRTKKIYREHLLNGAYQLVVAEGFKNFHARNVAKQIKCSTQPIYREFTNLTEFKDSLCDFIIAKIENYFKKNSITSLEGLSATVSSYAKKYPKEFLRFFVEDAECSMRVEGYIRGYFNQIAKEQHDYDSLEEDERNAMFQMFWYYIVGKGSLIAYQDREIPDTKVFLEKIETLYILE